MIQKTYRIPDMHCSHCVMRIESLEDSLPGIMWVTASYRKGLVQVEYDEQVLTEEAVQNAIQAQGYTVLPV